MLSFLTDRAVAEARKIYADRERQLGSDVTREVERQVFLITLDRGWREHMQAMAELLNVIVVRAKGAAALAEYYRESTLLFTRMRAAVDRQIVGGLFYLKVNTSPATAAARD